mmetsp:Transcript_60830/g.172901  ORF Transcript_60830/g.172901 Transcript_60830/m.172901 type:complete len:315 (+) Transcript_60830:51-995(+)
MARSRMVPLLALGLGARGMEDGCVLLQQQMELSPNRGRLQAGPADSGNESIPEPRRLRSELCPALEGALQLWARDKCKVGRTVTCVWGNTEFCRRGDICDSVGKGITTPLSMRAAKASGKQCGYVPDNAFVKFSAYSCDIKQTLPPTGRISCALTLTPLAVTIIVILSLVVGGGVCGLGYCCLVRPKHMKATHEDPGMLLLASAQRGDLSTVQSWLRSGADVNTRSRANATPLIAAAQFGHLGVVESLLEARADPHLTTNAGNTALLLAALRGHNAVVRLLLQKGADPQARNSSGWSARDVPGIQPLLERPDQF